MYRGSCVSSNIWRDFEEAARLAAPDRSWLSSETVRGSAPREYILKHITTSYHMIYPNTSYTTI